MWREKLGWGMNFEDHQTFVAKTVGVETGSSVLESPVPSVAPVSAVIVPVVLSGGGGSRLWPFSTSDAPKQFLPLIGERTLFQEALERVRDRARFSPPVVVGSVRHAELCERELMDEGGQARLILEPCARNTAAAIVMAATVIQEEHGQDALLLVMPSDHVIEDVPAFHEAIGRAETAARAGRLVTFGIRPTGPDTGYGYLHMGSEVAPGVMEVARFVEKPTFEVAEAMVGGGEHLWNAGIFLFRVGTLLEEVMRVAPAIGGHAQKAIEAATREGIRVTPDVDILSECPSESIDYAVMEHASNVAVVPMAPGWSDLGSWDALASLVGPGSHDGPVTMLDCDDCYIRSDGLKVAALGVRDLIIVASGQRLLVLPRGRSQEVKRLLSAMEQMAT
jgi:mannose-1-phosphate guanylyltransferase/mannose-1-phosphate guanylyltransferase/mannose-6-phosphate isomerase